MKFVIIGKKFIFSQFSVNFDHNFPYFPDSVVRQTSPKLRPNYFGRNPPKLRPKLRFRSYTIKQFGLNGLNSISQKKSWKRIMQLDQKSNSRKKYEIVLCNLLWIKVHNFTEKFVKSCFVACSTHIQFHGKNVKVLRNLLKIWLESRSLASFTNLLVSV